MSDRHRRRLWRNLILGTLLLFVGRPLLVQAQTPSTGALTGRVKDPQAAVIVGARVVLTKEGTGEHRETNTDGEGVYRFTLLDPVTYTVEISQENFLTLKQTGVKVFVTETVTLDGTLQVGGASEIVTVPAVGDIIQKEDVALGRVVDRRQVEELPLVTRNFTQILGLSPGIVVNLPDCHCWSRHGDCVGQWSGIEE